MAKSRCAEDAFGTSFVFERMSINSSQVSATFVEDTASLEPTSPPNDDVRRRRRDTLLTATKLVGNHFRGLGSAYLKPKAGAATNIRPATQWGGTGNENQGSSPERSRGSKDTVSVFRRKRGHSGGVFLGAQEGLHSLQLCAVICSREQQS